MAAAYPPGPPITPMPTQEEYEITINGLIGHGWVTNNIEYNWGTGVPAQIFRQDANTDYERVRKPNGRWLLFSRRRPDPPPPIDPNPPPPPINPGQGGRKRHKQKKSKKNKHSRKRRRTRKHN